MATPEFADQLHTEKPGLRPVHDAVAALEGAVREVYEENGRRSGKSPGAQAPKT
ncbi:hypothetical protein [Luteococcus sanguinis]|uniref:Uncharacterized protein n=1 Tax=Luteococcus sanguinis TaxID=174038 RepID=A0ABW1X0J0_9ACTN